MAIETGAGARDVPRRPAPTGIRTVSTNRTRNALILRAPTGDHAAEPRGVRVS